MSSLGEGLDLGPVMIMLDSSQFSLRKFNFSEEFGPGGMS